MINAIFAVDQFGGIGLNGSMPWPRIHSDMQHFVELTKGHVVVMGRRTYDDPKMPKPLPNRINIILSHSPVVSSSRNVFTRSGNLREVLDDVKSRWPGKNIWFIGGANLLMESKDYCDEMWIAHRKGAYLTDVRIDLNRYMLGARITSSVPNEKRTINWCTYKNVDIFRPFV